MAKKVVATLQTGSGKNHTKVIKMVKSPKSGAYTFKEEIVHNDNIQTWFAKNWSCHSFNIEGFSLLGKAFFYFFKSEVKPDSAFDFTDIHSLELQNELFQKII